MSSSLQTYSCTMPERRSKDHVHYLLVVLAFFLATTVLSLLTAMKVEQSPVLTALALVLAFFSSCAAAFTAWTWWDVR